MISHERPEQQVNASSHVRRSAVSAAIAAALMCYYGFGVLAAPDPNDLFGWCNLVLYYTLRIGGVGFGLIAVWNLIGHVASLAVDAVLSVVCGIVFMITALGMWIGGGGMFFNALLLVFGWLFTGVGLRNWRVYQHLTLPPGQAEYNDHPDEVAEVSSHSTSRIQDDSPQHTDENVEQFDDEPVYSDEYDTDAPDDFPEDPDDEPRRDDGGFLSGFGKTGAPPGV